MVGAGTSQPQALQGWLSRMAKGLTSHQLIYTAQISPACDF